MRSNACSASARRPRNPPRSSGWPRSRLPPGVHSPQDEQPADALRPGDRPPSRIRQATDARLGPRQPGAGGEDRGETRGSARRCDVEDVCQRRGLLPLRGVGQGCRRVHRAADLRECRARAEHERRADGAARADRRRRRRIGAPCDRRHPGTATRARTRSPLRASRSARGWSPACSRPRESTGS